MLTKRRVGQQAIYDHLKPEGDWNVSSGAIELF
jgi:hypothetical protein